MASSLRDGDLLIVFDYFQIVASRGRGRSNNSCCCCRRSRETGRKVAETRPGPRHPLSWKFLPQIVNFLQTFFVLRACSFFFFFEDEGKVLDGKVLLLLTRIFYVRVIKRRRGLWLIREKLWSGNNRKPKRSICWKFFFFWVFGLKTSDG